MGSTRNMTTNEIPYDEIDNGALILLLLRETNTWEGLCARYAYANAANLSTNTNTMTLRNKLFAMRDVGLLSFQDELAGQQRKPIGEIKETDLWARIRVALGGMSLEESAMISRHSKGMAVTPVFGRPRKPKEKIDVFVLMPFEANLGQVYTNLIKKNGDELGLTVRRADEIMTTQPFMEKVWDGICSAELIVADCTEKNANVFYEIGMAHTVGKKVALITRSDEDIPADVKHFDYTSYTYDPEGVEVLTGKLTKFLKGYFNR